MAQLMWQAAREAAARIRDTYSFRTPATLQSLTHLARQLGVSVTIMPLRQDVSGMIIKYPHQDAEIYIEANEPEVRQKFTLAHEIDHFYERASLVGDDEYSFTDTRASTRYDLNEFYADEFAGELLMPANEIPSDADALTLAHTFGVSLQAAQKRLDRLAKNPPQ